MTERHFSPMDRLLSRVDSALRTLTPGSARAERQPPNADPQPEAPLNPSERRHVTGLMRINHTGEVCAQALYQGQASTATLPHVRHAMEAAAREEEDHLAWCDDRIRELGGVPSRLNPLFYAVSYALGAGAGLAGDRWSLGFVSETERQVEEHLEGHLRKLPAGDTRSREIVEQMKADEARHGQQARDAGGRELPRPVRDVMRLAARVMTTAAYRL